VVKSISLRWVGNVTRVKVRTGVDKVLVEKRKHNRPLGKVRCKWDFNIKRDVTEIFWRA
jgi:hypothetical protein